MQNEFKMSLFVEFKFFFGFQVKKLKDDIFLSQTKYAKELVKTFGLDKAKPGCTTTVKLHHDLLRKVRVYFI